MIPNPSFLINVPHQKVLGLMVDTIKKCSDCSKDSDIKLDNVCTKCRLFNESYRRYENANIPLKYWKKEMSSDFKGDSNLLKWYNDITSDLKQSYNDGVCIRFAGSNGCGKTMTCTCILKRVVEAGYTGLYVNLSDIISAMIDSDSDDKVAARKALLSTDFLVIDEFDPRHAGGEKASELFGRIFEDIFRTRVQNCMPTFLCTNTTKVESYFPGSLGTSIASLLNYAKEISVFPDDFRKKGM